MRPAQPATTFTDITITNDQTGESWRARAAAIVEGRVEVSLPRSVAFPPAATGTNTFTVSAIDGAGRRRTFPGLTVDRTRTTRTTAVFL